MRKNQLLAYLKGACSGRRYTVKGAELEQVLHLSGTDLRKLVNKLRRKSPSAAAGTDTSTPELPERSIPPFSSSRPWCGAWRRPSTAWSPRWNSLENPAGPPMKPGRAAPAVRKGVADIARPVIPWVGGKEKLAPYITQVFPPNMKQYLEPFGGSAAVLLSMPPRPGRLDIYNDLNVELSNLHLCVKERCNALLRELRFLPIHSRAVFEFYKDFAAHKEITLRNIQEELEILDDPACFTPEQAAELRPIFQERLELYDVQRAAAYVMRVRGSFNATTNSFAVKDLNVSRFLYLFMSASERLQDVAIENKDAIEIIRERDGVNRLTYCDPPYFGAERSYDMEIAAQYHTRLHRVLHKCRGPVAVSYNDHHFIRRLYDDFYILAFTRDNPMAKRSGALYGELLMTNYDPTPFLADQLTLFGGQETEKLRLELVHTPKKSLIKL